MGNSERASNSRTTDHKSTRTSLAPERAGWECSSRRSPQCTTMTIKRQARAVIARHARCVVQFRGELYYNGTVKSGNWEFGVDHSGMVRNTTTGRNLPPRGVSSAEAF